MRFPIWDYYQAELLNEIYLDPNELFGEFQWEPMGHEWDIRGLYWEATREAFCIDRFLSSGSEIHIWPHLKHGFEIRDQWSFVPWLSYLNHGKALTSWDLLEWILFFHQKIGWPGRPLDYRISPKIIRHLMLRDGKALILSLGLEAFRNHWYSKISGWEGPERLWTQYPWAHFSKALWASFEAYGFELSKFKPVLGDDFFELKDQIFFPWKNEAHEIVHFLSFKGPRLWDVEQKRPPTLHLWPIQPKMPFFGLDRALIDRSQWIVVKTLWEALMLQVYGVPGVVAYLGTTLSAELWKKWIHRKVKKVYLAWPQAGEGEKYIQQSLRSLRRGLPGMEVKALPSKRPFSIYQALLDHPEKVLTFLRSQGIAC